jgi:hypothetical protein
MKRMVADVKSEKIAQELKDLETRSDGELKDRWRSVNTGLKMHQVAGVKVPQL